MTSREDEIAAMAEVAAARNVHGAFAAVRRHPELADPAALRALDGRLAELHARGRHRDAAFLSRSREWLGWIQIEVHGACVGCRSGLASSYCYMCGRPVAAPCPLCESANPLAAEFCGRCRAHLPSTEAGLSSDVARAFAEAFAELEWAEPLDGAIQTHLSAMLNAAGLRPIFARRIGSGSSRPTRARVYAETTEGRDEYARIADFHSNGILVATRTALVLMHVARRADEPFITQVRYADLVEAVYNGRGLWLSTGRNLVDISIHPAGSALFKTASLAVLFAADGSANIYYAGEFVRGAFGVTSSFHEVLQAFAASIGAVR